MGVVSVWVIEFAASVVWVIAAAVMPVRVTVGEIVGLVVGGIVGEVVGRTVDGTVGDAVGEVGTSLRCCWAGDDVSGPVWWYWCSKRYVGSGQSPVLGTVGVKPMESGGKGRETEEGFMHAVGVW